jgi:hypothetical protein
MYIRYGNLFGQSSRRHGKFCVLALFIVTLLWCSAVFPMLVFVIDGNCMFGACEKVSIVQQGYVFHYEFTAAHGFIHGMRVR